jgi:aspartate 1-decarboxylase
MSKYLDYEYFVIERNGVYWTDYLISEDDCYEEISNHAIENGDDVSLYTFRLMNDADIETYYPEIVENCNEVE